MAMGKRKPPGGAMKNSTIFAILFFGILVADIFSSADLSLQTLTALVCSQIWAAREAK